MATSHVRILRVCPGEIALVSTRDRYRVVVEQTNEILAELVRYAMARTIVRVYDYENPHRSAVIVSYTTETKTTLARRPQPYTRLVEKGGAA